MRLGVSCVGTTRNCLESPYHSYLNCFCHDRYTTRPTATTRRHAPLIPAIPAPTPRRSPPTRARDATQRPAPTAVPLRNRVRRTPRRAHCARSTEAGSHRARSTQPRSLRPRSTQSPSTQPRSTQPRSTPRPLTRLRSMPLRSLRRRRRGASDPAGGVAAAGDRRRRISSPPHRRAAMRTSRRASGCSLSTDPFAHTADGASRRA